MSTKRNPAVCSILECFAFSLINIVVFIIVQITVFKSYLDSFSILCPPAFLHQVCLYYSFEIQVRFTCSVYISFLSLLSFLLFMCACVKHQRVSKTQNCTKRSTQRSATSNSFYVISILHLFYPPICKYLISLISCSFFWCFFLQICIYFLFEQILLYFLFPLLSYTKM